MHVRYLRRNPEKPVCRIFLGLLRPRTAANHSCTLGCASADVTAWTINYRELYLGAVLSLRNISRKGAPEMQLQFVLVVSFSKL